METKAKAAPSANLSMHSVVSRFLFALKRNTRAVEIIMSWKAILLSLLLPLLKKNTKAVEIQLGSCTHADMDLQQLCNTLQV